MPGSEDSCRRYCRPAWYFAPVRTESFTRELARRYLDAWAGGELDAVRRLLADDVHVESNLDSDAGAPQPPEAALVRLATHLTTVNLATESYGAGRAVLMYDCLVRGSADPVRVVDFLDVDDDGAIRQIRRVYDVVALRRSLPDFDA